jgi:ABC-type multidrug transport system fused ATPase/permease subunit
MFGVSLLGGFCRSLSNFITNDFVLRMRTAVTSMLFQKALRVPAHTRREGDVMSLMTTDTMRVLELLIGVHQVWCSPIIIIIGLWLLYNQVGVAAFASLGALVWPHMCFL